MITEEMQKNGVHCKGQGFNCYNCKDKIKCVEYEYNERLESLLNEPKENEMVNKKSWKEFKDSGLLWWINMLLHTFGWAIVYSIDDTGNIIEVYPSRVKFRGFDDKSNTEGYIKVSEYLNKNSEELLKESKE